MSRRCRECFWSTPWYLHPSDDRECAWWCDLWCRSTEGGATCPEFEPDEEPVESSEVEVS